jgi:hypothetical protein
MLNKVIALAAIVIAAATLSCSSCGNITTSPDAQVIDSSFEVPKEQVVSGDTWEIILPPEWDKKNSDNSDIILLAADQSTETLVVMTKKKYDNSYDQFVLEALRNLRGDGVTLGEASNAIINNVSFTTAETVKDNLRMLMWVTVRNGFGYELSCGGPEANLESISDCQKIATSLKIR